jgi:hypothetical protein
LCKPKRKLFNKAARIRITVEPGAVVHTCAPSFSGGRGRRITL